MTDLREQLQSTLGIHYTIERELVILLGSFVDVRMPRDVRADAVVRRFHLDPEKWSHR